MKCNHKKHHGVDWPDGGYVEICACCGMSRYLWEQGETEWMVVDIDDARAKVEKLIRDAQGTVSIIRGVDHV